LRKVCFAFLSTGWAEEPKKIKFTIKPTFSAGSRLDSNYFLTENDERAVYTFLIQPGFEFGVESPKLKVSLDYTPEIYFYRDVDDVASGQLRADDLNYVGHMGALKTKYAFTPRMTLRLNDYFLYTRNPATYDRLSNSIDKRKYWINRLTPAINYDFGNSFYADIKYRYDTLNYIKPSYNDSTLHRIYFDVLYNSTRTTTYGFDYQYWTRSYKDKEGYSDYSSHQAKLDFQKRYKYFTFEGSAGYQHRSHNDPSLENENAFVYKISFAGESPPPPKIERPIGQVPERAKNHIYLAAERNLNIIGYDFIAYRFTLSMGHVFLRKILTLVRGYYQITGYEAYQGITPDGNYAIRDDSSYDVSGRIGYLITKKTTASITAGHQHRDSNLSRYSYDNNYIYFSFDFSYDLGSRGGFSEDVYY
jgi:hypothetical protein